MQTFPVGDEPIDLEPPVTTSRVTYAPPPQASIYPAQHGPQFSSLAGWGPSPMYAQAPIYAQPPWMGQLGGLFGVSEHAC